MEVGLWHRQFQHIRRLNVRHLLESGHQFGQIEELGKPCLGPVAAALRRQLNGGNGFSEVAGPIVKVDQAHLLEGIILQIPLDRVKLHHAIADGCAGGEDDTPAPGDLIQIPAFHKEVGGLLRFGLSDAAHIPHFGRQKEVLETMALVHEHPVNTQFLKGHKVVLAALVVEPFQLRLQRFSGAFQLLDRVPLGFGRLGFLNAEHDLVDLLL